MTDRDIVDAIDELVDEQLGNYSRRSGYDFNVNQDACPHSWCPEPWHGLPIKRRMQEMRRYGRVDPEYVYGDDESEVICPGSTFDGEFTSPEPAVVPGNGYARGGYTLEDLEQVRQAFAVPDWSRWEVTVGDAAALPEEAPTDDGCDIPSALDRAREWLAAQVDGSLPASLLAAPVDADPLDPSNWQEIGTIGPCSVQFTPTDQGCDIEGWGQRDSIRTDVRRELIVDIRIPEGADEAWRAAHQSWTDAFDGYEAIPGYEPTDTAVDEGEQAA